MSKPNDFIISDHIIESNNQYLIGLKPFGMPIQVDPTGDISFTQVISGYCKHPVHVNTRLDRPVGGVTLFSKSQKAHKAFASSEIKKTYLAIVEGQIKENTFSLAQRLGHDAKSKKAFISEDENLPLCTIDCEVLHRYDRYTLVKVHLVSGKFHQIRCQLASYGHPIKGDVKYKARRSNKDRSIHLFSYKIEFIHPISSKKQTYEAPLPQTDALWMAAGELLKKN